MADVEHFGALYRIFDLSRLSLPTVFAVHGYSSEKAGLSLPSTTMNRPSDAIPLLPEDLDFEAVDLGVATSQTDALPEHLALPLLWSQYQRPAVVLTTTVDKLFSVTATDIERDLALGGGGDVPEDLRLPAAPWCRTIVYVATRLGAVREPVPLEDLRSRMWTMKVFVDPQGADWTAESFTHELAIARRELW